MKERLQIGIQSEWPQKLFLELQGKTTTVLIIVIAYSVFQLLHRNTSHGAYWLMLSWSVISFATILGYVTASYVYGASGRKSYWATLLIFSGFIPYLFSLYLVVYQGLFGLWNVFHHFSFWPLIRHLVAICLGYRLMSSFYQITELDRLVGAKLKENVGEQK